MEREVGLIRVRFLHRIDSMCPLTFETSATQTRSVSSSIAAIIASGSTYQSSLRTIYRVVPAR
jgi:hypothetical protein